MKNFFSRLFGKINLFSKIKAKVATRHGIKAVFYWGTLLGVGLYLFWGIPLPTQLSSGNQPVSTKIFDRNGKLVYEIYTDKKRTPISLNEMPVNLKNATISIEDKNFYSDQGFSFTGIILQKDTAPKRNLLCATAS